jgi:hypothetical protein
MKNITMETGVIEYALTLGPLTLYNTLKLFTRLTPFMTSQSKVDFVSALIPERQGDKTITGQGLSPTSALIFKMFGNGHPARIVKIACESTEDDIQQFLVQGKGYISSCLDVSLSSELDAISYSHEGNSASTTDQLKREEIDF